MATEISEIGLNRNGVFLEDDNRITFLARTLIAANLPHRNPGNDVVTWERNAGQYRLVVQADPRVGLPFGSYPRLFLTCICRQVKLTRDRYVDLDRLYPFIESLGLVNSGRVGNAFRNQVLRVVSSSFRSFFDEPYQHGNYHTGKNMSVCEAHVLWTPSRGRTASLFPSYLLLNENFHKEVLEHSVPLDFNIIMKFKHSSQKLDLYCWLTYRMASIRKRTPIRWTDMHAQLGSTQKVLRVFRQRVLSDLKEVIAEYPCRVEHSDECLILQPSLPSVLRMSEQSQVD